VTTLIQESEEAQQHLEQQSKNLKGKHNYVCILHQHCYRNLLAEVVGLIFCHDKPNPAATILDPE